LKGITNLKPFLCGHYLEFKTQFSEGLILTRAFVPLRHNSKIKPSQNMPLISIPYVSPEMRQSLGTAASDGPICQHLMTDEYGASVELKLTAEK
jgi:hypothetical protein